MPTKGLRFENLGSLNPSLKPSPDHRVCNYITNLHCFFFQVLEGNLLFFLSPYSSVLKLQDLDPEFGVTIDRFPILLKIDQQRISKTTAISS